jgi:DNA-directed RNA polymerase subunit K/omega
MELDRTEEIEKAFRNRYEAVLKVAKHARRLNSERLRQKTETEEAEPAPTEEKRIKVVTEALQDLLGGKVNFVGP